MDVISVNAARQAAEGHQCPNGDRIPWQRYFERGMASNPDGFTTPYLVYVQGRRLEPPGQYDARLMGLVFEDDNNYWRVTRR